MRKIYLLIILIVNNFIGFCQNNGGSNSQNTEYYLPNITPPSPEAFAISEYGKNGVTESTGKLNLSIPIYNFNAGQLSIPISINYSGAGVKVNDISTWAGMNWNLVAGGNITRRVNDFADEEISKVRKYINEQHLITNASNTCADYSQEYYYMCFRPEDYDTEVDIFTFNFNGYNGSFFLDENFNPVYIENESELRIEIIGPQSTNLERLRATKTFMITTPDGVKYYFGGQETEQTMTFSGHRGNSILSNTSFYLYKIEHPINGLIEFEYTTASSRLSFISKSYNMRTTNLTTNNYVSPYTQQFFKTQINNPKILSKIKSNNHNITVNFYSTIHGSHNFISTLNRIEIKNGINLLKEFDLTHGAKNSKTQQSNDFNTASRFFLEKIEINKNIELDINKKEVYLFEYNDPYSLPARLSNSQDLLGYYNGETNETLIPYHSSISAIEHPFFANRQPNFELASKGTLNKVTYPTKGYSIFEYEPTDAKEKVYKTYAGAVEGATVASVPGNNGLLDEPTLFTPIYETKEVVINISTGVTNTADPEYDLAVYQTHKAKRVELKITDVTANSAPVYIRRNFGMNPKTSVHNFTFIKNHVYALELKILSPDGFSTFNQLNAGFNFTVFNGYKKIEGFGVRLKRQTDFGKNQAPTNIKRYYYRTIKEPENYVLTLPVINYFPEISYAFNSQGLSTNEPTTNFDMFGYFVDIHSEVSNKYCNPTNNEFYDVVSTSYGGDNFENGGTEKYFFYARNIAQQKVEVNNDGCWIGFMEPIDGELMNEVVCGLPSPANTSITAIRNLYKSNETTDMGMYNGKLIGERKFKNINGSLYKIEELFNEFDTFNIPIQQTVNFVGKELFGRYVALNHCTEDLSDPPRHAMSDCYLGYYLVNSFAFNLKETRKTEYIDPIPMSLYTPLIDSELNFSVMHNPEIAVLEANYKKIVTTQTFEYGALKGLPTVITNSISDTNTVNKTINTYVNSVSNLTGLPANQSTLYTSLLAQNRVDSPIQTQQFKNSELVSTQRTLHNNFTVNNVTKILPEKIQIAKGSQTLEDKAIFYNYDEHFNPVVMGYKDAPKTRYLFNTEGLVVAKIENYTGTATTFPLITGNIDNTSCALQTQNPNSLVTVYQYNLITKKVIKITDPNCRDTYYEYDDLQRLKFLKDHEGNIVKEFDQQFKPQN